MNTYTTTMTGADLVAALNADFASIAGRLQDATEDRNYAMVRYGVPITSAVSAGMLVYYDTESAAFAPALAVASSYVDASGASVAAPQSMVEGVIIAADDSQHTGTLLLGGYWVDASLIPALIDHESPAAGTYYLSGTTAGKVTSDVSSLFIKQPLLEYYGDGAFALHLFYKAQDYHYHRMLALSGSVFAGGTSHTLTAAELTELGVPTLSTCCIFYNGVLQQGDDADITLEIDSTGDTQYILRATTAPATSDKITLFNHIPFTAGEAIVRDVVVAPGKESLMSVSTKNGIVTLTPGNYSEGGLAHSTAAMSDLGDDGVKHYTPVVSEVIPGAGIRIETLTQGKQRISSSDKLGALRDAYSINFNGTTQATSGLFTYIIFPRGRQSDIVMQLPVADIPEAANNTEFHANIWAITSGTMTNLTGTLQFVADPVAGSPVEIPSETVASPLLLAGGSNDTLQYAESATSVVLSGPGTLMCKVAPAATPANDLRVLRIGFKITAVETDVRVNTDTAVPVDSASALEHVGTAGGSISQKDCVRISNGRLVKCAASSYTNADGCIGVAVASASINTECRYVSAGTITYSTPHGFAVGARLYIGATGALTDTPEAGAIQFKQCVAVAISPYALLVNIERAIVNEQY